MKKSQCSTSPSQVAGVCCEATAPLRLEDCRPDGCCRLEVQYQSTLGSLQWGTICDDYFSEKEAVVACGQLDLPSALARSVEKFGGGTGKVWLDDLVCAPGSTVLSACNHRGWGIHNCNHGDDVGVCCLGRHDCDPTALCFNTAASFECVCLAGFRGNGTHCQRKPGPFEEGDCRTGHALPRTPDPQSILLDPRP